MDGTVTDEKRMVGLLELAMSQAALAGAPRSYS